MKAKDPIVLDMLFTNVSTNEVFYISTIDSFIFDIVTPSLKQIVLREDHSGDRKTVAFSLDTNQFKLRPFTFNVSGLYKFDEIGTYSITVSRAVGWINEKRGRFHVVSNPLTVKIIPDK
jgi:hypothetical protein